MTTAQEGSGVAAADGILAEGGASARVVPQKRERIAYIDITRGILVLLMISSHAITLAGVPPAHVFRSIWWLPRGWAFDAFVTLSGFSAAVVFPWLEDLSYATRLSLRRARQILLVMFFSNILMLFFRYVIDNVTEKIMHLDWWIGLLTLKTEYSISGVLLATSLLLVATPLLARFRHRYGLTALFAVSLLFAVSAWSIYSIVGNGLSNRHLLDVLFHKGPGGFPLLPLASRGALGFALGLLWKRWKPEFHNLALLMFVPANLLVNWTLTAGLPASLVGLDFTMKGLARFLTVLAVAILFARAQKTSGIPRIFSLVGQYALFSFVAHRMVLQSFALSSARLFPALSIEAKYLLYVVAGMGTLFLFCALRGRLLFLDRGLKKLYL